MNFTVVICAAVSFIVCAVSGFIIVPYLHKLKFGQTILDIGPNWHKSKQGTPTMGGIMIILGFIVSLALSISYSLMTKQGLSSEFKNSQYVTTFFAGVGLALGMAFIGFCDDYIKVVKKRNLGLTAKQKTFLQFLVAACYLVTLAVGGMSTTYIPFVGDINITSGFGLLFWPVALMFIYGFSNAVNLTDGIDGLATTVTMVVSCAFMLISILLNKSASSVYAAAVAGACMGFVLWNAKPAKVFMGDTGSLFLGGSVIAMSFSINRPILLIAAGIVYLLEALSVIIQVTYYKKTKKRIFKMSPIHHHFEMCGWSENKIVIVFSFVALIGCFIAALPVILNF